MHIAQLTLSPAPPFPTHRLCRVSISLLSSGTMKELRLLESHLGPLDVPLAARYLRGLWLFARCRARISATAPGRWSAGVSPSPACCGGRDELSHVPREPSRACALLSDPGPAFAPGLLQRVGTVPLAVKRRTQDDLSLFGALSHGLGTRCLRFVPPSRTTTQDSLRRGGQPFAEGISSRLSHQA